MPKATIANADQLGFHSEQFGNPADWTTDPDGYLDLILQDVGQDVEAAVGASTYAAASDASHNFSYLRRAELKFVEAELWRRLEAFESSNLRIGKADDKPTASSRYLKNADKAETMGERYLSKVTASDTESGVAAGIVESGSFPVSD